MMGGLGMELGSALRRCRQRPASTLVAVVVLALGLGFATGLHAVVRGMLWRGLPIPQPDQLMVVGESGRPGMFRLPWRELEALDSELETFDGLAGFYALNSYVTSDLSVGSTTKTYIAAYTTPNFFDVLGVPPIHGRQFVASDAQPGAPQVALVSESLWRNQLGADSEVLGKTLRINRDTVTVVGVMPEGFGFPFRHDLWIAIDRSASHLSNPTSLWLFGYGRRSPGATADQARAELAARVRHPSAHRDSVAPQELPTLTAQTYTTALTDANVVGALRGLAIAVMAVLALAALNVAALLLARGLERRSELAVRAALGANPWQRMRPLMAETLLLACAGGLGGLAIAHLGLQLFERVRATAGLNAYWIDVRLDPRVLGMALVLVLGMTLLAGIAPAAYTARKSPARALRSASPIGLGQRPKRSFHGVMALQVALSGTLLITSALLLEGLDRLRSVELGFEPENLTMAQVSIWQKALGPDDATGRNHFFDTLLTRLEAHPQVESASLTSMPPLGRSRWSDLRLETITDGPSEVRARLGTVDPGFFDTLGIPLLRGRLFDTRDQEGSEPVVLVNRRFAERWLSGVQGDVVGRRLFFGEALDRPVTILGVVDDVAMGDHGLGDPTAVYQPRAQNPSDTLRLVVRSSLPLPTLTRLVEETHRAIDPEATSYDVATLASILTRQRSAQRLIGGVLSVLAGTALLVSSLGLFGSLSQAVRRRRREIGLRFALGGRPRQVIRRVVGQGLGPVFVGLGASLLLGFWSVRWLGSQIEHGPVWTTPLAIAALVFQALVALVASIAPAQRIARVDPASVLGAEPRE